jgi:hypothetical protein
MSTDFTSDLQSLTVNYFGASGSTANSLWEEFKTKGLKPQDPTQVAGEYLKFLSDKLDAVVASEAVNAISPKEDESRQIMFEAFNIAMKMLKALQACMRAQSKLSSIYADWQNRYVKMMAATPIYGPSINPKIYANNDDFGKTSLGGYGTFTVRDMLSYLMTQNTQSAEFFFPPLYPEWGQRLGFRLQAIPVTGSDTQKVYKFSLIAKTLDFSVEVLSSGFITANIPTGVTEQEALCDTLLAPMTTTWKQTQAVDVTGSAELQVYQSTDPTTWLQAIKFWWNMKQIVYSDSNTSLLKKLYATGIIGPWNAAAAGGSTGAWPELPGKYIEPSDPNSDEGKTQMQDIKYKRGQASSFRSELNAKLQLYLENARSLKTNISDASKRLDTLISQVKDSLQAQTNLMKSITESLRGLISAIYR